MSVRSSSAPWWRRSARPQSVLPVGQRALPEGRRLLGPCALQAYTVHVHERQNGRLTIETVCSDTPTVGAAHRVASPTSTAPLLLPHDHHRAQLHRREAVSSSGARQGDRDRAGRCPSARICGIALRKSTSSDRLRHLLRSRQLDDAALAGAPAPHPDQELCQRASDHTDKNSRRAEQEVCKLRMAPRISLQIF